MAVITLVVVCFQTVAHVAICQSDNALCGNNDDCATAECVCVCHVAMEPAADHELCAPARTVFISSEYVTLPGTSLPADIFRPPLENS